MIKNIDSLTCTTFIKLIEKQIKDCFFCDEPNIESSLNKRETKNETPTKSQQKPPQNMSEKKSLKHEEADCKQSFYSKKERVAHVSKNAAPPKKVDLTGILRYFLRIIIF